MYIIAITILLSGMILWMIRQNRKYEQKQRDWFDAVHENSVKRK